MVQVGAKANIVKAALIGSGIKGSLTPFLHNSEGKALGFAYRYEKWDILEESYRDQTLLELLAKAIDEDLAGLNVTHPFKIEAADLVAELSGVAAVIRAINTVVIANGKAVGYNTDFLGFQSTIRAELSGCNKSGAVLILGAGGAGAAVALALAVEGFQDLRIFDPDFAKAQALVDKLMGADLSVAAVYLERIDSDLLLDVCGIVNASPIGMVEHPGTPLDSSLLSSRQWIVDIIYFPLKTEFYKNAVASGCRVINGAHMAVRQAYESFFLITGIKPDFSRMKRTFFQYAENIGISKL